MIVMRIRHVGPFPKGCYSSGLDESGGGGGGEAEAGKSTDSEETGSHPGTAPAPAAAAASTKKPADAILNDMIQDLIQQLPDSFDIDAAADKFPINYLLPLNTVLVQEMGRYNRLVDVIRTNLGSLQRAVCGHATMTAELESTGKGAA